MKFALLLATVFTLAACDQKQVPAQSAPQPTVIRDSGLIRKEAANPYSPVDVSPMDMAYFPTDYPVKKMNGETKAPPVARAVYSRPHRGGRELFGRLLHWGQPWRLGANEATEIEFFQPVTVQKKTIAKGRYLLYAIPYPDHWTLILNNNLFSWGLKFNPADDAANFEIPSAKTRELIEHFTMAFQKTATGADLVMAWENTEARLPLEF